MNKREQRLFDVVSAIRAEARRLDADWPRSVMDDPMTPSAKRDLFASRIFDAGCLKTAAGIVDAMLLNADGFSVMITLAQKKPADFQALVVLAQIEIDRPAATPHSEAA